MRISVNKHTVTASQRIVAADEDNPFEGMQADKVEEDNFDTSFESTEDDVTDQLDDISDDVEDLQDALSDVQEDDTNIEIDNNISGHYIAECERCHGIFISAVTESDQTVKKITGVCPLCDRETDQYLKWVVKDIE